MRIKSSSEKMPLDISFHLGYPGLGGCQSIEGTCNGFLTRSDLYVVVVASLSDRSHDAFVCQIRAKERKAQGTRHLIRGDTLELQKWRK